MTDPAAARAFLTSEVDALAPFGFVAVIPSGNPLQALEVTRGEAGELEVRVPGRPLEVPPLTAEVHEGLRERGFVSEDDANPTVPWKRSVTDPEGAVDLLRDLLVEVFGAKPDVSLDISHGSHELEHEARKKIAVARTRIEGIVAGILGKAAEQDADGDYVLPIGDVHLTIAPRAVPNGQIVIRIFAITNVEVGVTPELGLFLARLNFGLMFGRFALDVEHRSIWFDEMLLGEEFREEELRFAIEMVATTADGWDDRLKQMFGGATYQEVLSTRTSEAPATTKPGGGVGQYL